MRLRKRNAGGSPTAARFVGWFIVAGVVAVSIAGTFTVITGRRAGEREAIVDIRARTKDLAQLRIQPAVTNALLEGNITAIRQVGAAIRHYVLDGSIARVKIWNKDGTIVYSDNAQLIGTQRPPTPDELALLTSGRVRSWISDPSLPENRFERAAGKLLEVDLRLLTPNRQPLRLAVYYRYNAVETAGTHVWNRFAPYTLGALAALAAVLILVGSLLARRLRKRAPEPEAPTEPVAEPAEPVVAEPVMAAPVVAAPVTFEPPAREHAVIFEPAVPEAVDTVDTVDAPVRTTDPGAELFVALSQLLARSNGVGVENTLDTDNVHDTIPPSIAVLLYRAAQETLRNRDRTTPVTVRVSDRDHIATLDIIEHGGNGHADLRALTDLVADAGGRLLVDAADNGGTRIHVEVPLP